MKSGGMKRRAIVVPANDVQAHNVQRFFPKINRTRLKKTVFAAILDSVRGVRPFLRRTNFLPMEPDPL